MKRARINRLEHKLRKTQVKPELPLFVTQIGEEFILSDYTLASLGLDPNKYRKVPEELSYAVMFGGNVETSRLISRGEDFLGADSGEDFLSFKKYPENRLIIIKYKD